MKKLVPGLPYDGRGDPPWEKIEDYLPSIVHQQLWDLEVTGQLPLAREPKRLGRKIRRFFASMLESLAKTDPTYTYYVDREN